MKSKIFLLLLLTTLVLSAHGQSRANQKYLRSPLKINSAGTRSFAAWWGNWKL